MHKQDITQLNAKHVVHQTAAVQSTGLKSTASLNLQLHSSLTGSQAPQRLQVISIHAMPQSNQTNVSLHPDGHCDAQYPQQCHLQGVEV